MSACLSLATPLSLWRVVTLPLAPTTASARNVSPPAIASICASLMSSSASHPVMRAMSSLSTRRSTLWSSLSAFARYCNRDARSTSWYRRARWPQKLASAWSQSETCCPSDFSLARPPASFSTITNVSASYPSRVRNAKDAHTGSIMFVYASIWDTTALKAGIGFAWHAFPSARPNGLALSLLRRRNTRRVATIETREDATSAGRGRVRGPGAAGAKVEADADADAEESPGAAPAASPGASGGRFQSSSSSANVSSHPLYHDRHSAYTRYRASVGMRESAAHASFAAAGFASTRLSAGKIAVARIRSHARRQSRTPTRFRDPCFRRSSEEGGSSSSERSPSPSPPSSPPASPFLLFARSRTARTTRHERTNASTSRPRCGPSAASRANSASTAESETSSVGGAAPSSVGAPPSAFFPAARFLIAARHPGGLASASYGASSALRADASSASLTLGSSAGSAPSATSRAWTLAPVASSPTSSAARRNPNFCPPQDPSAGVAAIDAGSVVSSDAPEAPLTRLTTPTRLAAASLASVAATNRRRATSSGGERCA